MTGHEFKSFIKEQGLRQIDLGKIFNYSQPTINNWLNGKRPYYGLATRAEKHFGLEPGSLQIEYSRKRNYGHKTECYCPIGGHYHTAILINRWTNPLIQVPRINCARCCKEHGIESDLLYNGKPRVRG